MTAAAALLAWYGDHAGDRDLPWRHPGEPLARVALVEGLLAQTRADAVARSYAAIFDGVEAARDWLRLPEPERVARVAPLGLAGLKTAALDSIAGVLADFDGAIPEGLVHDLPSFPGIGPYTAGMLAVMFGHDAIPVDCNVARVGGRAAADADADRWMAKVVTDATGEAPVTWIGSPRYEATCAILDIGQVYCKPLERWCGLCPLQGHCATQGMPGEQLILPSCKAPE
jgi:A/G-specific adenine glycosylase